MANKGKLCCLRHCKKHVIFYFERARPIRCKCGSFLHEETEKLFGIYPINLSSPFFSLCEDPISRQQEDRCCFLLRWVPRCSNKQEDQFRTCSAGNLSESSHIGVQINNAIIDFSESGLNCETLPTISSSESCPPKNLESWTGSIVIPIKYISLAAMGKSGSVEILMSWVDPREWEASRYHSCDHNCLDFALEVHKLLTGNKLKTRQELVTAVIRPAVKQACTYSYGLAQAQLLYRDQHQ